jgi:hypothetical protein
MQRERESLKESDVQSRAWEAEEWFERNPPRAQPCNIVVGASSLAS